MLSTTCDGVFSNQKSLGFLKSESSPLAIQMKAEGNLFQENTLQFFIRKTPNTCYPVESGILIIIFEDIILHFCLFHVYLCQL